MMRLNNNSFVDKDTPIYPGSFFSWGEVTKDLTRPMQDLIINGKLIASTEQIETNIVKTAKYMDRVREFLGNRPLRVNSWYRPPHINRRVGGSLWSRHQFGDAVDFVSDYLPPYKIYSLLNDWHGHKGGLGRYWSFVHLDVRGSKARWFG